MILFYISIPYQVLKNEILRIKMCILKTKSLTNSYNRLIVIVELNL